MSVSLPTKHYDLAAFGLLVSVSIVLLVMLVVRAKFLHYSGSMGSLVSLPFIGQFMGEDKMKHTLLYLCIFLAVVAATVLICVD